MLLPLFGATQACTVRAARATDHRDLPRDGAAALPQRPGRVLTRCPRLYYRRSTWLYSWVADSLRILSGLEAFWPEHFSAAPVPVFRDAFLVAEQPHTLNGLAAFGIVPVRPYSNSKG